MDCFFASDETRDFSGLRDLPIVVSSGTKGTCIISRSYEAQAYGIKTGMHMKEGRKRVADLIQYPSRSHVYAKVSGKKMNIISDIFQDIEVFSVDETFTDLLV